MPSLAVAAAPRPLGNRWRADQLQLRAGRSPPLRAWLQGPAFSALNRGSRSIQKRMGTEAPWHRGVPGVWARPERP